MNYPYQLYTSSDAVFRGLKAAHASFHLCQEGEWHSPPDAVVRHDQIYDPVGGDIVNQAILPDICSESAPCTLAGWSNRLGDEMAARGRRLDVVRET